MPAGEDKPMTTKPVPHDAAPPNKATTNKPAPHDAAESGRMPAGNKQGGGSEEGNSRQEAGDDERWRRRCNNQPANEDVNDTPDPSAQHQHNNQPYERGEEAKEEVDIVC